MNKGALKKYLKETRGYVIRSIKIRDDGNVNVYLKKPLKYGLTCVTINIKTIPRESAESYGIIEKKRRKA